MNLLTCTLRSVVPVRQLHDAAVQTVRRRRRKEKFFMLSVPAKPSHACSQPVPLSGCDSPPPLSPLPPRAWPCTFPVTCLSLHPNAATSTTPSPPPSLRYSWESRSSVGKHPPSCQEKWMTHLPTWTRIKESAEEFKCQRRLQEEAAAAQGQSQPCVCRSAARARALAGADVDD